MKTKTLVLLLSLLLSSCIKDVLDRRPLDRIPDEEVWMSAPLIDLYLVSLYDNIPIGHARNGSVFESNLTDEASHPYAGVTIVNNYGNQSLTLNTTMYEWIRRANVFLEKIGTSVLSDEQKKVVTSECRFIRAYYYFDLVKKYGGMPLILAAQSLDDPEGLFVPRNTEEEVYEFLLSELDAATVDLPESWDANNANRATKAAAQALKARAMLYAGSIAKFGTVQLNGLLGIPSEKADDYFNEAYKAAKYIKETGRFSLFDDLYDPVTQSGNPAANFEAIFLQKNNQEVIFQKAYSADKLHSYDTYNLPDGFKPGCCGNAQAPLLAMAESYEYVDGTEGKLDYEGKEFDSPDELFAGKDPRFAATIMRSETPFIGRNVQIYRGIYDTDGTLYQTRNAPFEKDPGTLQVGRDGPYTLGDVGKTGFYLKKYLDPAGGIVPESRSTQNYIDFRYAEILLTLAEASFEAGIDLAESLDAINLVRNRAGMPALTPSELTRERIRNERKVELAFEDKRFWDIKRYRIGTDIFRNTYVSGLWPYLKYTGTGYKYIFKKVTGAPLDNGQPRVFQERDYYSNLAGYIASNRQIVNNPGW
ncbi:RagB/SusD family nutrient uptake outer membrane protein [Parapedobacter sp. GCM10030251]|jgi:SusD family.|uniref:RagB/SusD family nutrient uptake outer membrane protein n=1 Tax=Parapedobacter sp. GCM10030251 TaxID=3273419 RepID=UPI0036119A14